MNEEKTIHRGLEGVVADDSAVSAVMEDINSLTYRGYRVEELCEQCSFEEVAYLLLNGDLPNAAARAEFCAREREQRGLSKNLQSILALLPRDFNLMDGLRTAVSLMGLEDVEARKGGTAFFDRVAIKLLAQIPTALALLYRHRKGLEPIKPDPGLPISENFFK